MALTELEYLRLPKFKRFGHKFGRFIVSIPRGIAALIFAIGRLIKGLALKVAGVFSDVFLTWKNGDWKTRLSFFVMGFGNIARGQVLRGIVFLVFEVAFIVYMVLIGGGYIAQIGSLGDVATRREGRKTIFVDNSFRILLYGVVSIMIIVAFVVTWYMNVKQNKIAQEILATGKPLKSGKQDLQSLVDDQFHKTLLSLPLLGIFIFTVLPIFFMILIAFTNFDHAHQPPGKLFDWVGFENFANLFGLGKDAKFGSTFGEILLWTLIWAFFATFTNYFLGMVVAMIINKKGIKLKKLWRTVLVVSIAIPQFISLLYVGKMFTEDGMINGFLKQLGWIKTSLPFWKDAMWARITVIIVNIWIGIPYLMLITSGVLMNIPSDLYESAKIDGASPWKMYIKITLPYMLFVTGPYLLSSFIGNMNNFNVIYLLSGGAPADINLTGGAGHTDLLITWLYKLTVDQADFNLASVIGILVFVVVAFISVIIYNTIPSMKNEEDFQ